MGLHAGKSLLFFKYKLYTNDYLLLSTVIFRLPAQDRDSALQQRALRKVIQHYFKLTKN
jgi:hypothetical protein